jgi:cyclohexanecarboxylate-CoA ligase
MNFPEDLVRRFYDTGHWRPEDLWATIEHRAAATPAKTALICGDTSISFAALVAKARHCGLSLAARGVGAGDVVVVHGRNGIDATVTLLGCLWLGAVVAPLPPMFSEIQVTAIAESASAKAVFCLGNDAEIRRAVAGAQAAASVSLVVTAPEYDAFLEGSARGNGERSTADPDALTLLVYSSGTTGTPKGVMHSANTIRYAIEARARMHSVDASDICLVVCQFGFVGSIVFGLLTGPVIGATSVLMPAWDAAAALALITRHRVSYGLFMPTHVHDLLQAPELDGADLSSLGRAAMGGLPTQRRRDVMRRLCPTPLPGYGMSECLGNSSCTPSDPEDARIHRDGRPYPGTQMRIVGSDGTLCASEMPGEIQVCGPSRCLGYYRAPELTQAAFTADGFFRTGDLGSMDASGFLTFAGREKDIIRRGSVTIVPGEVEAVLAQHPAVQHAAIVGLPDPRYGEIACACIVPVSGAIAPDLDLLTAFLAERGVARYQWPERVALFDEFPRTPSLKVKKPALVKALVDREAAAA